MKKTLIKILSVILIVSVLSGVFFVPANAYTGLTITDAIEAINWLGNRVTSDYLEKWDKAIFCVGEVSMYELQRVVDKLNELHQSQSWWAALWSGIPKDSLTFKITNLLPENVYRIVVDYHVQLRAKFALENINLENGGYVYKSNGTFPYVDGDKYDNMLNTPRDHYSDILEDNRETNIDNSTTVTVSTGDIYSGSFIDRSANAFFDIVNDRSVNIDSLVWNPETHSYFLTYYSDDETYNYEITYNITNTSITYIGATAEETETYKFYYQLPDGRNSADLTNEDLAHLSVAFDIMPYGKSATDTNIRSLYHFDANTEDSSYFADKTAFTWNQGASITYLESNAFNGCLYLDELTHEFEVKLPSRLGSGDFTIQWRYYQQESENTSFVNRVSDGAYNLLTFSGNQFKLGGSVTSIPIGTWNEIALIRSNGVMYLYLNGVAVLSYNNSIVLSDELTFHFNSASACYKQIDELRILNIAYSDGGSSYSPTSVPFDSNAVLVLPDEPTPIADAYWDIDSSHENKISNPYFDDGVVHDSSVSVWPFYAYSGSTVSYLDGFTRLTGNYDGSLPDGINYQATSDTFFKDPHGYYHKLYSSGGSLKGLVSGRSYSVSVVEANGDISSFTFTLETSLQVNEIKNFDWGCLYFICSNRGYGFDSYFGFRVKSGVEFDFVYIELADTVTPDLSASYVTVQYSDIELEPMSIALQTQLPLIGYQCGGVRPSLPSRGFVWFYVIDGRIRDTQIYTGYAWQSIAARLWTGERWIPVSSYNVILMQEMFDVGDGDNIPVLIVSQEGFWSWFVDEWNSFRAKLIELLNEILDGAEGNTTNIYEIDIDIDIEQEQSLKDVTSDGISGITKLLNSLWKLLFADSLNGAPEAIDSFTDSFDTNSDNPNSILSVFTYEGDVWA